MGLFLLGCSLPIQSSWLTFNVFAFNPNKRLSVDAFMKLFDRSYLQLATTMMTQSVFKHVLTEGDKFLVSRLSPLQDQGGYALANNYGKSWRLHLKWYSYLPRIYDCENRLSAD